MRMIGLIFRFVGYREWNLCRQGCFLKQPCSLCFCVFIQANQLRRKCFPGRWHQKAVSQVLQGVKLSRLLFKNILGKHDLQDAFLGCGRLKNIQNYTIRWTKSDDIAGLRNNLTYRCSSLYLEVQMLFEWLLPRTRPRAQVWPV